MFVSENRLVLIRKNHMCFGCGTLLKKGDMAATRSGVGDDGWWNVYLCACCRKFETGVIEKNQSLHEVEDYYEHPHEWPEYPEYKKLKEGLNE